MSLMIKKARQKATLALTSLYLAPSTSFAGFGGGVTVESILQKIIDYLTGDVAQKAGVLAIVGAGYLYLASNHIKKETFIKIAVGLGIILGGPALYDTVVGG